MRTKVDIFNLTLNLYVITLQFTTPEIHIELE